MNARKVVWLGVGAVAIAVVAGLALARSGSPATANPTGDGELGYAYAAKFLCGPIQNGDGPLADGEYATAINVHNLQDYDVHVFKKAVVANPEEEDFSEPSPYKELDVPPDAAFEIDCPDTMKILQHPCRSDVNGDGFVNMTDAMAVFTHIGSGHPAHLAMYDLDLDGDIDVDDANLIWDTANAVPGPDFGAVCTSLVKGFVVVQSASELDVWGVYTSAQTLPAGSGISEDIEVVPYTRQPLPVLCIDRDGDTSCRDADNDPDDDGCTTAQEAALGSVFDPNAWYDVYDVPAPVAPDPALNGPRSRKIDMQDIMAVLFYYGTKVGGGLTVNGVDYDSTKGIDTTKHNLVVGHMFDRSAGLDPDPVTGKDPAGPPSGKVDMIDVMAVLGAYGINCQN